MICFLFLCLAIVEKTVSSDVNSGGNASLTGSLTSSLESLTFKLPDSPSLSLKLPDSPALDQDHDGTRKKSASARGFGSGLLSPEAASFHPTSFSSPNGGSQGSSLSAPSPSMPPSFLFGTVWNPVWSTQDWSPLGSGAPSPPNELVGGGRPRSSSRSAPSTPRVLEWGTSMPYSTAPVSPATSYNLPSSHAAVSHHLTVPVGSSHPQTQQPPPPSSSHSSQSSSPTSHPTMLGHPLPPMQQLAPPHPQQQPLSPHGAGYSNNVREAYNNSNNSDVSPFPPTPDLVYSAPVSFPSEQDDDDRMSMPKQAEHPSRTLFVRNLANDTDPLALQAEFEQFGPVRSIYANCKYRGFVMISFFDIRHAKAAMLVLNGKKVQGKKMDIHYALPKDNPGEKESNQGTLVVFNLDPSMNDDDIRQVFGEFGEVKDIRSTPNKNTHKFVEFYDVRDAERALLALNRTKVRSKIIKIEVSRPSNRGRRKGPDPMGQGAYMAYGAPPTASTAPSGRPPVINLTPAQPQPSSSTRSGVYQPVNISPSASVGSSPPGPQNVVVVPQHQQQQAPQQQQQQQPAAATAAPMGYGYPVVGGYAPPPGYAPAPGGYYWPNHAYPRQNGSVVQPPQQQQQQQPQQPFYNGNAGFM